MDVSYMDHLVLDKVVINGDSHDMAGNFDE